MKEQVHIAAAALESHPDRLDENLRDIERYCRRAADQGVELVLFPELSLTGFIPNHPVGDHAEWLADVLRGAWRSAQPLNGEAVGRLLAISSATGVFLAAGLLENAGNLLFNTHVLVGSGKLYGFWRKMHIPLFETQIYNGGGAPDVVDTPLGRIGVNICFDAFLPESTRLLAVQNPDIVLFPFAADPAPVTPAGWADWAGPVLQARCSENGVFGVACNYRGDVSYAGARQSFPGGAMFVGPSGRVLATGDTGASDEHMLVAALQRQTLIEARSRFEYTYRFRRPELYASIAKL